MEVSRLLRGELEEADLAVGADDLEDAFPVFDIRLGHLQLLGGQRLGLLDGALRRDLHRRAAGEQRPGAGAAEAVGEVGVALDDADPVDRHAEHVDGELRVAGGDALAHRLRGGHDLDEAVGGDPDGDPLLEDVAAGPFEEGGDADAAQPAAGTRLREALRRSRPSPPAPAPGP